MHQAKVTSGRAILHLSCLIFHLPIASRTSRTGPCGGGAYALAGRQQQQDGRPGGWRRVGAAGGFTHTMGGGRRRSILRRLAALQALLGGCLPARHAPHLAGACLPCAPASFPPPHRHPAYLTSRADRTHSQKQDRRISSLCCPLLAPPTFLLLMDIGLNRAWIE